MSSLAGNHEEEKLAFAQTALLAMCVSPVSFMFAFPAGDDVRFGENVVSLCSESDSFILDVIL